MPHTPPLPWIAIHLDIRSHRKTQALEDAIGDPLAWAYVVGLLLWVAEHYPDGSLAGVPPHRLARGAGYTGDPDRFLCALLSSGYLEPDHTIHDWTDYQRARHDRAVRQREQAADRKRRQRDREHTIHEQVKAGEVGHAHVTRDNSVTSRVTLSLSNSTNYNSGNCMDRAKLGDLPENPWTAEPDLLRAHLRAITPQEALSWPDPAGTRDTLRSALSARYSAWDGVDGRPTVDERAIATWDSLQKRLAGPYCVPSRAITAWIGWMGDGHDRALAAQRRSTPTVDPASLASDLRVRKRGDL